MDDANVDGEATGIIAAALIAFVLGGVFFTDYWVKRPCKNVEGDLNCAELVRRLPGDLLLFSVPNVHPTLSQVRVLQEGIDLPCPWFQEALQEIRKSDRLELASLKPRPDGSFTGNIRLGKKNKKSFKQVLLEHGCDSKMNWSPDHSTDKERHATDQPPSGSQ